VEWRVRDPVHNFISLREQQVELIGTRSVQRLRGIHQLALANLVYPGAVHTRFDHTLGVAHVAGLMARSLGFDEDRIALVQNAAVLHDIGHGPFSHVSERALQRYTDTAKLAAGVKLEKIHEAITARMIREREEIVAILGTSTCEKIIKLLGEGYGLPALRSIVSGPLDADKQDYLLRDSHFCGVEYGLFDIHQLHRSLVLRGAEGEEELMIDPDGIHAVEQFVMAKYYLTANVYRHRVRLITDQMIVRAIVLGIDKDGIEELHRLYAFEDSDGFLANYSAWDDARFLGTFGAPDQSTRCAAVLRRLRERRLLKQVFKARTPELRAEAREILIALPRRSHDGLRVAIETAVAEELASRTKKSIDPDLVIVHTFDIKSVRETSRNEEAGILVSTDPEPRSFTDESALFRSINEGYVEQFVEVYAPVDWAPEEKNKIRRESREVIKDLIESRCLDAAKGAPT
jgi:HD superfamily phosphohydrolase